MKIKNSLLDYLVEKIDDLYIVTKRVDVEYDGVIPKNCLAILRTEYSDKDYREFWCVNFKRTGMFGCHNFFNLTDLFNEGSIIPLTKDEKYEILLRYAKDSIKKSSMIRKKARKLIRAMEK